MSFVKAGRAAVLKTLRSLREQGIRATAGRIRGKASSWYRARADRAFDRRFGTDTSGVIELSQLSIESDSRNDGIWYEPASIGALRRVLDRIDPRRYPVLVDYGSGKGRVLLVASEYPFRRIVGVEFSRELHETALRNFAAYRNPRQRCRDLMSVCMDAVAFDPPAEPCVFFFFSPFRRNVMQRVLEKIRSAASRDGNDMAIVFVGRNPETIASLDGFGWHKQDLGAEWDANRTSRHRVLVYRRHA
ncbi:MAG TPA: class I SAM-dependent methyltransferase [Planctomycetota bacterium]|nr:class I SAM-dependent methyltransferase [Planctomycetota bacterium]